MSLIIYIDILLAVNLFVDFLLLSGVARVLHRPHKRFRLILGATVGALSSLMILLPPLPLWMTLTFRTVCAAVMVGVAFPFYGIGTFARTTAVLFVISALFAGMCEALWLFAAPTGLLVERGVVYYDVPPLYLVIFTSLAYGALCLYNRLTVKRVARGADYRLQIRHRGQEITLTAMLDTGCSLCDPFSGAPVALCKTTCIADLLAAETAPLRYIPFSALGGEGMLPSFRPERVTVFCNNTAFDISGTWIAATDSIRGGEYDALIGPALVNGLPLHAVTQERSL